MMNKIFFTVTIFIAIFLSTSTTFAATIEKNASVAVMDFGTHPEAVPIDIDIFNAGKVASEYVIDSLVKSNKFDVMDKSIVEDRIKAEKLNTTGIIDSDTARRIGQILGVKYIIYGNVNDVTLSDVSTKVIGSGVTVCTVKAHLILRMMNVETGDIICIAKGEGKSKSSGGSVVLLDVGNVSVTQTSVHNALKKSAFQAVDILLKRLYGKS
ncbi:MAG: hypothetical protein IJ563_05920 [Selenomonadaceae bacterium]|nr:hypothetical protein [Selenomonadaceae bacterium]MBR1859558.1 hypothetical protein [Selenomonadaceae bacterium]